MSDIFSRTEILIGEDKMAKLKSAHVILFGVGGVGSYAAEALARSGVGSISIVDDDDVSETNINRQLIALSSTVGMKKTEVTKRRILDINSECNVITHNTFVTRENADSFDFSQYDFIIDAIDSVSAKLKIAELAYKSGTPEISVMGTGNKLNPMLFEVADIYDTSVCPLARVMRKELRKRGVPSLKVVYSKEEALTPNIDKKDLICEETESRKATVRRQVPGSMSFVPGVAGLIAAGEAILTICGIKRGELK